MIEKASFAAAPDSISIPANIPAPRILKTEGIISAASPII